MQKTTKPLQNLQGFCKKLQKIQKTVKNILPDPLVCFTIVKDKGVGEKPGDLSTRFLIPEYVGEAAGGTFFCILKLSKALKKMYLRCISIRRELPAAAP